MLTKHNDIEIPVDTPFINDKLDRQKIAKNLTLLVQSTNQPFVISIEAPWGWGKTTFIKMWKTHLESLGHTCLYFNAWENDFVEDPLIAFIGEISKTLDDKKTKGKIGTQIKKLQNIGGKIVRRALPITIQLATQGIISQDTVKRTSEILFKSSDEIASFASELATEKIKQYESDKNGVIEFKRELTKFAKTVSEGNAKKAPLIFFIDELDRCAPNFSISLLERIKHIFNVEGIVFILGIDREQIEQSVKSIYGQGMKPDGYLRRFIDFRLSLPTPSTENFCKFIFERFHMQEVFDGRRNKETEYSDFLKTIVKLADSYRFSLRVIEQCFTDANLLLRTTPVSRAYPSLAAFLIAFKASRSEYSLLRNKLSYSNVKDIIAIIKKDIDINDRFYFWLLAQVEAHLIYSYLENKERGEAINAVKIIAQSETDPFREYAKRVLINMEHIEMEVEGVMKSLVTKLDLVEELYK